MQQPLTPWWQSVIEWIASNTVIFMIFGLCWKFFDKLVEIYEKSQDARITRLIEAQLKNSVTPEITKLTESIDELKKAIWTLRKP